jgi:hypothetical protein
LVYGHFYFLVAYLFTIKRDLYAYILGKSTHYCEAHISVYNFFRYGKGIIFGAFNIIILEEKIFKRKRKLRNQIYILVEWSQLTVWSIILLEENVILATGPAITIFDEIDYFMVKIKTLVPNE